LLGKRLGKGDGFLLAASAHVADAVGFQVDRIRYDTEQGGLRFAEEKSLRGIGVSLDVASDADFRHAPRNQAGLDRFATVPRQD
jgi:hypothetical protein